MFTFVISVVVLKEAYQNWKLVGVAATCVAVSRTDNLSLMLSCEVCVAFIHDVYMCV